VTCSDGAYNPSSMCTRSGVELACGAGPTDSNPDFMSSYQAELSGILVSIYIIHRICNFFHTTSGRVTNYCDNKGAILKSFHKKLPSITPCLTTDYDLICLAQNLLHMLPITVIGSWVKGHYEGKNRELQHDMNDMADNLATTHLAAPPKLLRCPLAPPGYRV
jgi:hypothetical protein